jgi:hypothetical protein
MKAIAVVTIRNAPAMTRRGRKDVAKWMYRTATWLDEHGDDLGKSFVARYYVRSKTARVRR